MIFPSALLIVLLSSQAASACESVEVCRAQALIAHAKGDFEAFHDYAWAASRKGKPNDPELMLLIARAQSLSGRPGDALVMLERVARVGKLPSDLATDPEFERVRALPRWKEVADSLLAAATGAPAIAPDTRPPAAAPEPGKAAKPEATKGAAPKPVTTTSPVEKPESPPPAKPERPSKRIPDPPREAKEATTEPSKAGAASSAPDMKVSAAPPAPVRTPGASLKFTTGLTPTALAYDRVSKRYIIADRRARRIAVIDENTGQVSTLVGAMGGLSDVDGIAIDAQQGDLWAIHSGDEGLSLSKLQLISGRVLSTVRLPDLRGAVVALTFVPGAGLVAADADGVLWSVRADGRSERLGALEYVPRALGADTRGRLYVSAGGPRLARFGIGPFRRLGTVEVDGGAAPDGPFVVLADRLERIVTNGEGYELRSSSIK